MENIMLSSSELSHDPKSLREESFMEIVPNKLESDVTYSLLEKNIPNEKPNIAIDKSMLSSEVSQDHESLKEVSIMEIVLNKLESDVTDSLLEKTVPKKVESNIQGSLPEKSNTTFDKSMLSYEVSQDHESLKEESIIEIVPNKFESVQDSLLEKNVPYEKPNIAIDESIGDMSCKKCIDKNEHSKYSDIKVVSINEKKQEHSRKSRTKFITGVSFIIGVTAASDDDKNIKYSFDCVACNETAILMDGKQINSHVRTRNHVMNILEIEDKRMFNECKRGLKITDEDLRKYLIIFENSIEKKQLVIASSDTHATVRQNLSTKIIALRNEKPIINENLEKTDNQAKAKPVSTSKKATRKKTKTSRSQCSNVKKPKYDGHEDDTNLIQIWNCQRGVCTSFVMEFVRCLDLSVKLLPEKRDGPLEVIFCMRHYAIVAAGKLNMTRLGDATLKATVNRQGSVTLTTEQENYVNPIYLRIYKKWEALIEKKGTQTLVSEEEYIDKQSISRDKAKLAPPKEERHNLQMQPLIKSSSNTVCLSNERPTWILIRFYKQAKCLDLIKIIVGRLGAYSHIFETEDDLLEVRLCSRHKAGLATFILNTIVLGDVKLEAAIIENDGNETYTACCIDFGPKDRKIAKSIYQASYEEWAPISKDVHDRLGLGVTPKIACHDLGRKEQKIATSIYQAAYTERNTSISKSVHERLYIKNVSRREKAIIYPPKEEKQNLRPRPTWIRIWNYKQAKCLDLIKMFVGSLDSKFHLIETEDDQLEMRLHCRNNARIVAFKLNVVIVLGGVKLEAALIEKDGSESSVLSLSAKEHKIAISNYEAAYKKWKTLFGKKAQKYIDEQGIIGDKAKLAPPKEESKNLQMQTLIKSSSNTECPSNKASSKEKWENGQNISRPTWIRIWNYKQAKCLDLIKIFVERLDSNFHLIETEDDLLEVRLYSLRKARIVACILNTIVIGDVKLEAAIMENDGSEPSGLFMNGKEQEIAKSNYQAAYKKWKASIAKNVKEPLHNEKETEKSSSLQMQNSSSSRPKSATFSSDKESSSTNRYYLSWMQIRNYKSAGCLNFIWEFARSLDLKCEITEKKDDLLEIGFVLELQACKAVDMLNEAKFGGVTLKANIRGKKGGGGRILSLLQKETATYMYQKVYAEWHALETVTEESVKSVVDVLSLKSNKCPSELMNCDSKCIYYHTPLDFRRNPITTNYREERCELSNCPNGISCHLAHNKYEVNFFPTKFQTTLCPRIKGADCDNGPMCEFAHRGNSEVLRDNGMALVTCLTKRNGS